MALTRITGTVIEDNAITTDKISNAAITGAMIAAGAISADKLSANVGTAGPTSDEIIRVNANLTANVNSVKANVDATQANVAAITDSTTDLNIGSGKYVFDKSLTSLGINNTLPIAGTVSLGVPANIILKYSTLGGNVLINSIDDVSSFRFDVRGTANTGVLKSTQIGIGTTPTRPLTIESGENEQIRLINTLSGGDVKIEYRNSFGTDTNWFGGLEESDGSWRLNFKEDSISSGEDTYFTVAKTMQVGIGTASPAANLHVVGTSKFTDQVNMDDDLVVLGNLIVTGDTTTVNTENLVIQDNFMALANSQPFDSATSLDSGIFFNRGSAGNAALYYDQSITGFRLSETRDPFSNTSIAPNNPDANLTLSNAFAETIKLAGADLATMIADNRSGAVSTVFATNLTASRALASDGSGKIAVSAVTATELGHLDGVSGAIQTQLDSKISTTDSASNDFITFARLNANVNVVSANVDAITGGGTLLRPISNSNVQAVGSTSNTFFIGAAMPGDGLANILSVTLDGVTQQKDVPSGTFSANNDFIMNAVAAHASIKFTAPSIPEGSTVIITALKA